LPCRVAKHEIIDKKSASHGCRLLAAPPTLSREIRPGPARIALASGHFHLSLEVDDPYTRVPSGRRRELANHLSPNSGSPN
jgi:hypothetical protein